jgi:mercuric reductase
MDTRSPRITGMTCESCAQHVRQALAKVSGVVGVDVSYRDGKAEVKAVKAPHQNQSMRGALSSFSRSSR